MLNLNDDEDELQLKFKNLIKDIRICGVFEGWIYSSIVWVVAIAIFLWYIK